MWLGSYLLKVIRFGLRSWLCVHEREVWNYYSWCKLPTFISLLCVNFGNVQCVLSKILMRKYALRRWYPVSRCIDLCAIKVLGCKMEYSGLFSEMISNSEALVNILKNTMENTPGKVFSLGGKIPRPARRMNRAIAWVPRRVPMIRESLVKNL